MVLVALVQPGNPITASLESCISPLLYKALVKEGRRQIKAQIEEQLASMLAPYVSFIEVGNDDDTLQKMVEAVGTTREHPRFNTESSYGYTKGVTEIFYEQVQEEETEINVIGCYHSLEHTIIRGRSLVLANRFVAGDQGVPRLMRMDTEMRDIIRVIRRRFYRSAILIDGDMIAKYYYQDSQNLTRAVFGDRAVSTEYAVFMDHCLCLCRLEVEQGVVNKIGSRVMGRKMVGPIIFSSHLESPGNVGGLAHSEELAGAIGASYDNLTEKMIKRIGVLAYGDMEERRIKPAELIKDREGEHWCRYLYLERRMTLFKKSPMVCAGCRGALGKKQYTCPVTYRYKYCSPGCVPQQV